MAETKVKKDRIEQLNITDIICIIGDVKTGMQPSDHNGWIKLDGRLKSTLTTTQQENATALGIGVNLPDATNSFLVQNGTTLGSVNGSNTRTIAQNQLPNVTLSGTTSNSGNHVHNFASWDFASTTNGGPFYNPIGRFTNTFSVQNTGSVSVGNLQGVQPGGNHNHTISNINLNGGVTQELLDITPQILSVNTFIYLGN